MTTGFRGPASGGTVLRRGDFVAPVMNEVRKVIVGQEYLINRLMLGLLCNGHLLIEGVPGLAKTLAVKTLSDTRRTIPVRKDATDALRAHKARQNAERLAAGVAAWQDAELVFTDDTGRPLDGIAVTRSSFYLLLKRAGLPRIRFHDLRHTDATLLLEAGVHPRVVAERLGHATPSLVMNIYGHARSGCRSRQRPPSTQRSARETALHRDVPIQRAQRASHERERLCWRLDQLPAEGAS